MAINEVNQNYDNPVKQEWRMKLHSLLNTNTCIRLVDDYGRYCFKWVELVAREAKTFSYALSTGKITEDKLIGINNDNDIIMSCQHIFPNASFIYSEWDEFCLTYNKADLGVIVFDSCNAAFGSAFEKSLRLTLGQVSKSVDSIGECMLVINVDGNKTYRGKAHKRIEDADRITKAKMTMCDTINKILNTYDHRYIKNVTILPNDIYQYKQTNISSTMLSCFILFG